MDYFSKSTVSLDKSDARIKASITFKFAYIGQVNVVELNKLSVMKVSILKYEIYISKQLTPGRKPRSKGHLNLLNVICNSFYRVPFLFMSIVLCIFFYITTTI